MIIDATAAFGPWRTAIFLGLPSAATLVDEMDWCGIDEAVVYCTAQRFDFPPEGNRRLVREVSEYPRLHPTIAVLPSATEEPGATVDVMQELRATGARAVRLFPQDHRYLLDDVTLGDHLAALEAHGVPVFIRDTLDRIGALLRSFPDLIAITDGLGGGPLDRFAWPLAERYTNLRFETSSYLVDGGIEAFVRRFGAERLVFASGVPLSVSGSSLLQVLHAEIDEADRAAILGTNIARLLAWRT